MGFNNFYTSSNENECPLQVTYLLIYFTCDVNVTLMSCKFDSVCCMCGEAWSSRWLMTHHSQHALQTFPGQSLSRTDVSRTRLFPDKSFPGQTFPGQVILS